MLKAALSLVLFFFATITYSQSDPLRNSFFRFYIDNDAINFPSNAHDWGYTSGNRIDLFYTPVKANPHLLKWLNQSSEPTRVNTSGWGLMQIIVAPQKTSLVVPDKNDYPYSGALFAIHTVHSANSSKKMNLRSEWVIGIMGPSSYAKETHSFFHSIISDPLPKGWGYQLPTDLLLNYNLGLEKQLAIHRNISLIGGADLFCGSMKDALSIHLLLQTGKNWDYFGGATNLQFAVKKPMVSVSLRATADFVLYDALLDGGLFNKDSPVLNSHSIYGTGLQRLKFGSGLDASLHYAARKFALSISQKTARIEFKKYRSHFIGNITAYFLLKGGIK